MAKRKKPPLKRPSKNLTRFLFVVYLLTLTWVILLKLETNFELLGQMNFRSLNLIPFSESVIVNDKLDWSEILLNVGIFIPFGVYLSMLYKSWNVLQRILPVFLTSLLFEVLQYVFAIGASDVTDLLMNTLGGLVGMLLFWILLKIMGIRIIGLINRIALIGTAAVILFLGVLTYVNR